MRRLLPAIGLFFLAPLVAEYLLGDMPITAIAGLFVMGPMYGGGALLIREVCRRAGWGWAGMITLAVAYGVVEEGLITQSLFNPDYAGKHLLVPGHIATLGIGASWTVFVLTLHMVWSIGVPIASVELLASPDRRTAPWLGRAGLIVTAGLFAFGAAATMIMTHRQSGFSATAWQLGGVGVLTVLLIALAAGLGSRAASAHRDRPGSGVPGSGVPGSVPSPLVLTLAAALATSGATLLWYLARNLVPGWLFVTAFLAAHAVAVLVLSQCARRAGWSRLHVSGLVTGALITYAWESFAFAHMLMPVTPAIKIISHVVFSGAAAVLVTVIILQQRKRTISTREAYEADDRESYDLVERSAAKASSHRISAPDEGL